VGEVLTSPAHGGRVDNRGHFEKVVHEYGVEEGLVAVLERLEDLPFADVVGIDAGLDDLVLGVGGGTGRPSLLVLLHHDQGLFVQVLKGGRDNACGINTIMLSVYNSVGNPDPEPDLDPHVLGLPDPDPIH
jgi:hypothetical protein